MRTVVSGVRNSCDTSDTNCCCTVDSSSSSVILRSSSPAMRFIERARLARSSVPTTAMRSSRWPAANRSAASRAARMGRSTCSAISHTTATTPTSTINPATTVARCTTARVSASGWLVNRK